MKKLLGLLLVSSLVNCGDSDSNELKLDLDFRQEMRDFVQGISSYSKNIDADFLVIPQNGAELVTVAGDEDGAPASVYLAAIDGVGREDLYYGYNNDNQATPSNESTYLEIFLDLAESNGVEVLSTDYCSTESKIDDSYAKNTAKGYTSFAAPERDLNVIPTYPAAPNGENTDDITTLSGAANFLYLLDAEGFGTKSALINAINETNYDAIIIDAFFDEVLFTTAEINSLKTKKNGSSRLVIAYMSIGEAEDYRYYWDGWKVGSPEFVRKVNPVWAGNYKVYYWNEEWQAILYGNDNSYLKKIIDAEFDGVYLDLIEAYEYFE